MDASSNTNLNLPNPASGHPDAPQLQPLQVQPVSPPQVSANDPSDELDKEWISRAKHIVEQTKQDPFTQSKEMGKIKADYLRIRFNKHISVGKDQAL